MLRGDELLCSPAGLPPSDSICCNYRFFQPARHKRPPKYFSSSWSPHKHSVFFLRLNSKCLVCAKARAGGPVSSEDSGGGGGEWGGSGVPWLKVTRSRLSPRSGRWRLSSALLVGLYGAKCTLGTGSAILIAHERKHIISLQCCIITQKLPEEINSKR